MSFNFENDIIAETKDWLAVRKPHGLHVLPDRYNPEIPTVTDVLRERYPKLYIVHRLDSGTGGILLLAKNAAAHRYLNMEMEAGRIEKTYKAIVKGEFKSPVSIMLPISARNQKGRYKINFTSGRSARTSFYPVASLNDKSLISIELYTGRTHQIRVHLRAHGFPLAQDWLYGVKCEDRRLSLFADGLSFTDIDGSAVALNAPYGDFMLGLLKKFEIIKD